jgi:hypothetical protein
MDGAFNDLFGHVGAAGILDGKTEAGVKVWVRASFSGGNADFPHQPRKELASLSVIGSLLAFDLGPLTMTSHMAKVQNGFPLRIFVA